MQARVFLIFSFPLLLAACKTVGPDYAGPPTTPEPAHFVRAGELTGGPPISDWWTSFNDPVLNSLVDRALQSSPNLVMAKARLQQARAALQLERANGKPNASASFLYAHARLPPLGLGGTSLNTASTLNLYNAGFDATWEIDLFGGHRRAVEAADASMGANEANLADAQLSLTAEVVQAYVNLRSAQARVTLSADSLQRQEHILTLAEKRLEFGTASKLDIERLRNQLESTRSEIEPLHAELDSYRDELAILTDNAPGALDQELEPSSPVPLPPAQVNTGDPAAMLRRRPDIRAAERMLAARNAQIGQAEAARFPQLKLLGLIGLGGASFSLLKQLDNYTAVGAPQLSWNVFDFGRASSRIDQAQANKDEAAAQYRATVLSALRDAEDSLSRYRHGRTSVAASARSKEAADHATVLMQERYRFGTATLIDVLDSERQQIAAEQNLTIAIANLTNEFVSLQKALGLGWKPEDKQSASAN
jgi:NodT family efflux transporter outer membrane factor (OMF) lipoprotein